MNSKAKGTRLELQILHDLESQGFSCTRAAASLGLWDIIAVSPDIVLLVQIKTGRFPRSEEFDKLLEFIVPECVVKLLVVKKGKEIYWYELG